MAGEPATPSKQNHALTLVLCLLLVVAITGFAWAYKNYQTTQKQIARLLTTEGQQELAKQQIESIVGRVGQLIVLPADEEPTVASIVDVEKLAVEQPFYAGAKNGDQVLIYVKNRKAIIYDPDRNILVNVGPVSVNADTGTTPPPAASSAPAEQ